MDPLALPGRWTAGNWVRPAKFKEVKMALFHVPDFDRPACAKPEHLPLVDAAYRARVVPKVSGCGMSSAPAARPATSALLRR